MAAQFAHAGRCAPLDPYRSSRGCIREAGLAEDDVSGAFLTVIMRRGDHEIAKTVAIERTGIGDDKPRLRTPKVPGVAHAEVHVKYGAEVAVIACRDRQRQGN